MKIVFLVLAIALIGYALLRFGVILWIEHGLEKQNDRNRKIGIDL